MVSEDFTTYAEFRPTAFDHHINIDDAEESREHWYVAPASQTRDSGALNRVNFAAAVKLLGGESETVEVHRFGHWGPGWFEILLVNPADETAVKALQELTDRLENYPVLDEEELSSVEYDEAVSGWHNWGADDTARAVARDIGIGATATDRLAEFFASDDGWQWWMDNSSAPYEHDSEGTTFPAFFRFCSGGRVRQEDRDKCAELLQTVRKWEQRDVLTWDVAPA